MSRNIKLESLSQDQNNFNKHTQRGMGLLEKSIEQVGIIESITVSNDNEIITGNARHEVMAQKFNEVEPIIVETDGTRPIVLKRTDITSNTKQFYKAAILANTVSKHNIDLDIGKIQEIAVDEHDINIEELGVDIPSFENDLPEDKIYTPTFKFEVECKTESDKNKLMSELLAKGYLCTDDY